MLASGLTGFFLDFYLGGDRLLILSGALSLTQAIEFCLVVIGALLLMEKRPTRLATS